MKRVASFLAVMLVLILAGCAAHTDSLLPKPVIPTGTVLTTPVVTVNLPTPMPAKTDEPAQFPEPEETQTIAETPAPTEEPRQTEKPAETPAVPAATPIPADGYLNCCGCRLLVKIPEDWKGQYIAVDYGDSVAFFQQASYYREFGGFLFSFELTDFTSEEEIQNPSYEVVGKWEGDKLLIADFPTDVQFDFTDEEVASSYKTMYTQFDLVKESLVLNTSGSRTIMLCGDKASVEYQPEWEDMAVLMHTSDSFGVYSRKNYVQFRGGHIFTLMAVDESYEYENLPSYDYLGEKDGTVFIVLYPTDVQFQYDDPDCTKEYQDLSGYTETVVKEKIRIN